MKSEIEFVVVLLRGEIARLSLQPPKSLSGQFKVLLQGSKLIFSSRSKSHFAALNDTSLHKVTAL